MCLPSLREANLNFNITCISSFKFQRETKIICCRDFRSQTTQILVILRCCFAENGSEMYKAYNALEELFSHSYDLLVFPLSFAVAVVGPYIF